MNAIVLAGGFGTRLKPLTDNIPKPMLSVANVPMLDYTISHLTHFGINNFVFTLGYYPQTIIDFASGYKHAKCRFMIEGTPLGTAGGVQAASKLLDNTFIVASGDALEDIDFGALVHKHESSGADITMAVTRVLNPSLYGVVEIDEYGTVTGFSEKPPIKEAKSNLINCGIYVINKSVLQYVPQNTKFDFARDLFPIILKSGKISAYIHDGYWCDIGDVRSYYAANFYMSNGGFFPQAQNIFTSKLLSFTTNGIGGNLISDSASIVGSCRGSIIGHGARVASGSSVDNCIVLNDTVVTGRYLNCIIGQEFQITVPGEDIVKNPQVSTGIYNNFL